LLVAQKIEAAAENGNADLIASELKDIDRDIKKTKQRLEQYEEAFLDATSTRLRKLAEERVAETERDVKAVEVRREALAARLRPYQELEKTKAKVIDLVAKFSLHLDDPDWLTPQSKRGIMDGLGITVHAYQGEFRLRMTPPVDFPEVALLKSSL
jgi:hypothetical protein